MDSFQIMYEKVIDNFESFLQLWEECLEKKLDLETKARIVVCKSQMESFYFIFFGIRLSCKVYAMTDNLSKLLQSTMMPAIKGKKLADLVVDKLRSMRNDEDFYSFFEVVKKAPDPIKPVGKLTKESKKTNYSILQYVTGYEGPESNAYHPETAQDYFKSMYFQILGTVISTIHDQFEEVALKKFRTVEELL